MKVKPWCFSASVEHVPDNRMSQTASVCAVDTQLMGASGLGKQSDVYAAVRVC